MSLLLSQKLSFSTFRHLPTSPNRFVFQMIVAILRIAQSSAGFSQRGADLGSTLTGCSIGFCGSACGASTFGFAIRSRRPGRIGRCSTGLGSARLIPACRTSRSGCWRVLPKIPKPREYGRPPCHSSTAGLIVSSRTSWARPLNVCRTRLTRATRFCNPFPTCWTRPLNVSSLCI